MQQREAIHRSYNPFFHKEKTDDRWVYIAICLLITTATIYFIFFAGYFTIREVQIEGNQELKTEEIKNIVDEAMNKNRFLIFPQKNLLMLSSKKLKNSIEEKNKNKFALENLTVEKDYFHTLKIIIKERIPGLVYVEVGEGSFYYLDLKGIAAAKLDTPEEKYPKIYDQNKREIKLGEATISPELMDFIINLSKAFGEKTSIETESFALPEIKCQEKQYVLEKTKIEGKETSEEKKKKLEILEKYERGEITGEEAMELLETTATNINTNTAIQEVFQIKETFKDKPCDYLKILTQVNVKTKTGFVVYFNSELDLERQINNLNAVLSEEISDPKLIQYIDLRFNDRVYFK